MTAAVRRQFCGLQNPSYEQRTLHAFWNSGQDRCFPACSARMCLRTACPARACLRTACPAGMRLRTACPAVMSLRTVCSARMCLRTACPARACLRTVCSAGMRLCTVCSAGMCRQPVGAGRIYWRFALFPGRFYFFAVPLTGFSFCCLVFVRQACRWSSFSMSAPSEGKNTSAPGCGREKALLCRSAQDLFGSLTEICEYRIPLCIRRQMLPENVSLLF